MALSFSYCGRQIQQQKKKTDNPGPASHCAKIISETTASTLSLCPPANGQLLFDCCWILIRLLDCAVKLSWVTILQQVNRWGSINLAKIQDPVHWPERIRSSHWNVIAIFQHSISNLLEGERVSILFNFYRNTSSHLQSYTSFAADRKATARTMEILSHAATKQKKCSLESFEDECEEIFFCSIAALIVTMVTVLEAS